MLKSATLVFPMAGGGRERLYLYGFAGEGGVTDAEKCNPCISDGWRGKRETVGRDLRERVGPQKTLL